MTEGGISGLWSDPPHPHKVINLMHTHTHTLFNVGVDPSLEKNSAQWDMS